MKRRTFRQVVQDGLRLLWSDVKEIKWVIMGIIAYFVVLRTFFHGGCPWVLITGMPCPGCGLTRAGICLLHFDFVGAWKIHPFIYAVIFFVLLFGINRYVFLRTSRKWMLQLLMAGMLLMVAFYVWRMFRYYPGEPPMSYYSGNLLSRIREFL